MEVGQGTLQGRAREKVSPRAQWVQSPQRVQPSGTHVDLSPQSVNWRVKTKIPVTLLKKCKLVTHCNTIVMKQDGTSLGKYKLISERA